MPSLTFFLSQRLHDKLQGENILVDRIPKMDIPSNFNSDRTQVRSPLRDAKASFLVRLFHTPGLVGTRQDLHQIGNPFFDNALYKV